MKKEKGENPAVNRRGVERGGGYLSNNTKQCECECARHPESAERRAAQSRCDLTACLFLLPAPLHRTYFPLCLVDVFVSGM